jgi:hypothetical protein
MRLFLTSYQKSGTHQIMQALMHEIPNIEDYSGVQMKGCEAYGFTGERPLPDTYKTTEALRDFEIKAFGHIPYLAEFAEVFREVPTRVLFNIRDPRDIVVAEHENIRRHLREERVGLGHMNIKTRSGIHISDSDDPIAELIRLAALRWPNWYGWLDEDFTVVVRYEDLRQETRKTLIGLQKALSGCVLPSLDDMIAQATNTKWSHSFRKGLVGEWETAFRPHHKEMADDLLGPVIERLGYVH